MLLLKGGPFENYGDLVRFMLQSQLKEANVSTVIDGWKLDGMRGRIDEFVEWGRGKIFNTLDARKVLVHSDFSTFLLTEVI